LKTAGMVVNEKDDGREKKWRQGEDEV
jgi:hypothetical protein